MDERLLELGVGGLFAYVIIKEVFSFVGKTKRKNNGDCPVTEKLCNERSGNIQQSITKLEGLMKDNFAEVKTMIREDRGHDG